MYCSLLTISFVEFKVLLGRKTIENKRPKRLDNVRDPFNPQKWGSKNAVDIAKLGVPSYVNWASSGMVTPVKNQVRDDVRRDRLSDDEITSQFIGTMWIMLGFFGC